MHNRLPSDSHGRKMRSVNDQCRNGLGTAFELVPFAMQKLLLLKFKPRKRHGSGCAPSIAACMTRSLTLFVLLIGFFGVGEPLPAQEQKSPAKPIPEAKPHDPLGGKGCTDCHRRVVSSNVKCLLAKEDLCEFCHQGPGRRRACTLCGDP